MAISNTPSVLQNIIAAKTYNAAWFSGSTKEAQITAAIAAAVLDGALYVYVPASMLPYTAANVTFNNAIRMIREGGDPSTYDVKAYGAAGNNVQDDIIAINAAISASVAIGAGLNNPIVVIPPGTYLTTSAILINADYITIVGSGIGSTRINNTNTTGGHIIQIVNPGAYFRERPIVKGLWLLGAVGGGAGIYIDGCNNGLFDEIMIFPPGSHGIQFGPTWNTICTTFRRVIMSGMLAGKHGFYIGAVPVSTSIYYEKCRMSNASSTSDGWHYDSIVGKHAQINFSECLSESMQVGIRLNSCRGINIISHYFENNSVSDLECGTVGDAQSAVRGVSVTGAFANGSNRAGNKFFRLGQGDDYRFGGIMTQSHGGTAFQTDVTFQDVMVDAAFTNEGTVYDATFLNLVNGLAPTYITATRAVASALNILSTANVTAGFNASLGNSFVYSIDANRTFGAPTGMIIGQRITITVIQINGGTWNVLWNAVFKKTWSDVGNVLNARSSISYIWDGTNWNQDGAQAPYV